MNARPFEVFTHALLDFGYVEGQNLAIERGYRNGRQEPLPALAAEPATRYIAGFLVTTNITA